MMRTNNSEAMKASCSTITSTTAKFQLHRMLVYIALRQLESVTKKSASPYTVWEMRNNGLTKFMEPLFTGGYITTNVPEFMVEDGYVFDPDDELRCSIGITKYGGEVVKRYLQKYADELRDGHFGKFAWSKRTKFHKAIMDRIA